MASEIKINVPEFIETVRNHPELYDKAHQQYKNNVRKTGIWREIATAFQMKDGNAAAAKWKSIRDQFRKKMPPTGTEADAVIDNGGYIFAQYLSFLLPHLDDRPSSSSSLEVKSPNAAPSAKSEIDELQSACLSPSPNEMDEIINVEDNDENFPPSTKRTPNKSGSKRRREEPDPIDEAIIDALKKEPNKEDSAGLYGQKIAQFLRQFTQKKQLQITMAIDQIMLENMPDD